ncbi:MAG: class IV adenylate cyclase [archaeon]|jgi:predicted adenylyl cyclase CyaB
MKEIEVLVELFEDKEIALKKLSKTSKEIVKHTKDIYYFHEQNEKLKPKGNSFPKECFRIRSKQGKYFLAYKIDRFDKKGVWVYSDEYETEIKEFETTNKIISLLGYTKLVELNNTKHTFETKEFEIVLEEVKGLGVFLEIESKETTKNPLIVKKKINDFIKSLNIKTSKELNAGKPELMLKRQLKTKK